MIPQLRWTSPQLDARQGSIALGMLSAAELRRHDAMVPDQRDSFLAGRLLLRRLAGEMLGVDAASIRVIAVCADCGGDHGRPTVDGSDLHLSLARSAGAVVAAGSWAGPIGVDLESATPSAEQLAAIGALSGRASIDHWTRVEAVLKADGRGLRVDPSEVSIADVDGRLEGRVAGSRALYDVSEIDLAPGVRVSVAVAR